MSDPVLTPTALIVIALATGAAAAVKQVAESVIVDSYNALKSWIQSRYPKVSLTQLEELPESELQRSAVQEALDRANAGQDEELLKRSQDLVKLIQKMAPNIPSSINISMVSVQAAADISVRRLAAEGSVTTSLKDVTSGGSISIDDVVAGNPQESKKKE